MKRDGEFVEEDKVVIAHKEVHDHVFGGCARKREEDGKEAKENVENGNQGFGCAREDKETQTSSVSKSCRKITLTTDDSLKHIIKNFAVRLVLGKSGSMR
ncbi:hypothetical protein YC2023_022188 [Brassica napus]